LLTLGAAERPGWQVAAAAALLGLAGMVEVPVTSGNRLSMAWAVAASLPFVFRGDGGVAAVSVVAAYAGGLALLWAFRTLRGESPLEVLAESVRRSAGLVVYLLALVAVSGWSVLGRIEEGWRDIVPVTVAAALWLAVEVALWATLSAGSALLSRRYLALLAMKDLNVMIGLVATGALFGLSFADLGWWSLGIAAVPYLFAHNAFGRFQATRRTYRQTIRALARIPEVAGLATAGHSDRTAELAVAVAKDLGLTPDEVAEVEFAALMHDIGRITLNEPSIVRMGFTDEDIARWGSEIISEAPYLRRVAGHVRNQHEPYRRPGEERDPGLAMASKIIRAASAYDHAQADQGCSPLEAVEVLHRGAAYDFDPDVVASVRRVLEERRVFEPVRA
ncbi:MAG: HD-GYP domain-containing protein, partial [Acidimicrobiia bacterium]